MRTSLALIALLGCTSHEEATTAVDEAASTCGPTYSVSAAVDGLAGHGLRIQLDRRTRSIATDGVYRMASQLHDRDLYDVIILDQPIAPLQVCTAVGGRGQIDKASVVVPVHCVTSTFPIAVTVDHLAGTGLVLRLNGEDLAIAGNGTTVFPTPLPDLSSFAITVAAQPTAPNQVCTVANGIGQVSGAGAVALVHCEAPGNLRITEIASCIEMTSCWLEIWNSSPALAESLSLYQLRTKAAIRTFPWSSSERTFTLPDITIPAGGFAVIRGRSNDHELSGGNLVYLFEGNVMPWWNANGFAELLADGKTIDFVRWAGNPATPATGTFSGTAPNLPTNLTQGAVIARDLAMTDTDSGGDWRQHAWGTLGGPNDLTEDADADNDGVPDQAERPGATYAGLDLYAMGAREGQRDIFVQVDRMASNDAGLTPRREALDQVVAAFAARGFALHFDAGPLYAPGFDPALHNLGGGNAIPFFGLGIAMGATTDGRANFYTIKTANIDVRLRPIFHYMLFAWSVDPSGAASNSGLGEVNGNDALVTFGGWNLSPTSPSEVNRLINYQAAVMMHELGHNFGLRHGGNLDQNYKPNYVSIMNYTYALNGLSSIGTSSEGDRFLIDQRQRLLRFACPFVSVFLLPGSPYGPPAAFRLDYSDGSGGSLDENNLSDFTGLRRSTSMPVDFNCSGTLNSGYGLDLDGNNTRTSLGDYNDWANLKLVFQRTTQGNDHFATEPEDNGDVQPTADEEMLPPPEELSPSD